MAPEKKRSTGVPDLCTVSLSDIYISSTGGHLLFIFLFTYFRFICLFPICLIFSFFPRLDVISLVLLILLIYLPSPIYVL